MYDKIQYISDVEIEEWFLVWANRQNEGGSTLYNPNDDSNNCEGEVLSSGVCGRWAFYRKSDGKTVPFLCGSRRCGREECKRIFHWRRVRLISTIVSEHCLDRFFTLTTDPEKDDGLCPWKAIPKTYDKFMKRIRRLYHDIKYIAILEAHKNGRPHIHGFWNRYIPWKDIVFHWSNSGGGIGVYVEYLRDINKATDYVSKQLDVAKYVGKDQVVGVPTTVRKALWRSQHTKASFELKKETEWDIIKDDVYDSKGKQVRFYG